MTESQAIQPTRQFVGYVPVLHRGYLELFERIAPVQEIQLLGTSFRERFRIMTKDIRAADPHAIATALRALIRPAHIRVIETHDLPGCLSATEIVMPDEDITRELAAGVTLRADQTIMWDSAFLRWDKPRSETGTEPEPDRTILFDELDENVRNVAMSQANSSADWWRRVGAVLFRGHLILESAGNHHVPSDYSLYEDGDPRGNFRRGIGVEYSTALHAEATCIAAAAFEGLALGDASIFVTTFPCPGCARLIAAAGITTCYYLDGYAMLEGDRVLRDAGVEIVQVRKAPTS